MHKALEALAEKNGDRLIVIDIKHLEDLKAFFKEFNQTNDLNHFQQWITNEMYDFTLPDENIKSLILMAINHPLYARVDFVYKGKKKTILSLVRADFKRAGQYLKNHLEARGYFVLPAFNLPLKRLGFK